MKMLPRNESHLPSIKCSTCEYDIDLALISGHICTAPVQNITPSINSGMYPTPANGSTPLPPHDTSSLRPPRPILPKIDSSVAVQVSFAGELTPASSGGSIGSPVSATSGRRSPWRAPLHRPTIMVQQGPPSPELVNLDCAFPPFPVMNSKDSKKNDKAKSRSAKYDRSRAASPASSARSSKQNLGPSPLSRNSSNGSFRPRARSVSGDNKLRAPSISASGRRPSGPTNGGRKPSTEQVPPVPTPSEELSIRAAPLRPLERADTAPVFLVRGKGSSQTTANDLKRHATTDCLSYRDPEHVDDITVQNAAPKPEIQLSSPFPLAQPRRESQPGYRSKRPAPVVSNLAMLPRGTTSKVRSPTVPPASSANNLSRSLTKLFGRRRSQSALVGRRGMIRSALGDEPDSARSTLSIPGSAFEAPRQAPFTHQIAPDSANSSPSSLPIAGGPVNVLQAPNQTTATPVVLKPEAEPATVQVAQFDFEWSQPKSHDSADEPSTSASIARRPTDAVLDRASLDSASSYGSSGFGESPASSRSSPPSAVELASKIAETLQTEPMQMTTVERSPPLQPKNWDLTPDSPTDPLFVDGRLSPIPSDKPKVAGIPSLVADMPDPETPALPARQDSLTDGIKQSVFNKGICRGCSIPILPKQKSVTSADGRLSGRYHKECFVCSICISPFSTAEFYVHGDRPYCAHHYHEQEDSLCATCGKGIEGLYMETANVAGRGREKHHPQCLKCTTCCVQLTNDYFELSGNVYCERDAFRLASAPRTHDRSPARPSPLVREYISSGDPKLLQKGTNFPERRITKIMTKT